MEIRDLDKLNKGAYIHHAICEQLHSAEDIPLSAIKSIQKAYGGTQTAVMSLTAELVKNAPSIECIRVGWPNCIIREQVKLVMCKFSGVGFIIFKVKLFERIK